MVKRKTMLAGAAVLVVAAIGITWAMSRDRPAANVLRVAGSVRSEQNVVTAPALQIPTPDLTVGSTALKRHAPVAGGRPTNTTGGNAPIVAGMLTEVLVTEGQHVNAGQTLALFDPSMLSLGLDEARASERRTLADVEVLHGRLDELSRGRGKLRDTRSDLEATLARLVAARAGVTARIAALQRLSARPTTPTTAPPSNVTTSAPDVGALLGRLLTAAKKLDAGIARLRTGLAKIEAGERTLASTRDRLADARDLLEIAAEAQGTAVRIAEARLAAATIVSPVSGIVLYARVPGSVAMVGSPLFRLRPDAPVTIDTYLTSGQLARVGSGTRALVTFDSMSGTRPLEGKISHVASTEGFPPTSFPTDVTHMTRTVRVTITLDPDEKAPPGTPVDITLSTLPNRETASGSDHGRTGASRT